MSKRKKVSPKIESQILVECGRRCCLCFGLLGDLDEKRGQIAHLDHNPSNNAPQNPAYLCLDHHDQYDSKTSQSKGITIREIRLYRASLLEKIAELREKGQIDSAGEYNVSEVVIQPEVLKHWKKASLGRCIAMWQATGLSREEAKRFAGDPNYGVPEERFFPTIDRSVVVLVGQIGTGKTLILERMFQYAIDEMLIDPESPIPIFLNAQKCVSSLRNCISDVLDELQLSYSSDRNAIIFLDNIDLQGPIKAEDLLTEARVLVHSWPNLKIVMASRSLDILNNEEESINISPLSQDEANRLMAVVSRHKGIDLGGYPKPVQDASCYPLFSILIGISIKDITNRSPRSIGELISFLVEKALKKYQADKMSTDQLLQNLAVNCIEQGKNSIPYNEFLPKGNLLPLIKTRLLFEDYDGIGFQLPIFKEWFAAQALASDQVNFEDIFHSYNDIEKWRYALQIFVSTFSYNQVSKFLNPICERYPALASRIVKGSVVRWEYNQQGPLISDLEMGSRICGSMRAWISGIGELARIIAPVNEHGSLGTLGIRLYESSYTIAWYQGVESLPKVHLLSRGDLEQPGWPTDISGNVGKSSAWPWRHTLDQLKEKLSRLLNSNAFSAIGAILTAEDVWQSALSIGGYVSFHSSPIRLTELERKIGPASIDVVVLSDRTSVGDEPLIRLRETIRNLRAQNIEQLNPPWPGPDLLDTKPSWAWDVYSPEQLLIKTKMVYEAAILSYKLIVDRWFASLANRMWTAAMLPACLHGTLSPHKTNQSGAPSLQYYWEPLSQDKESIVDITMGEIVQFDFDESEKILAAQRAQIRSRRPENADWMSRSISQTGLDELLETKPVTQIVHKWLESDLKSIDWI